jgi:predicted enzyme related to lactoylglutathione lyase
MKEKAQTGTFCWSDLGTTDAAAAKRYYGELFGWRPFDVPNGERGTYSLMRIGEDDVAAIYTAERGMPVFWLAYVAVDSVDEAAKKTASLGGKVEMGPFDAMDAGRMAIVSDPTGAAFALWEGRKNPGAGRMNEGGALCWFELHTPDVDRAAGFFAKMFGWSLKPGADYTEIHVGTKGIGGMMPLDPKQEAGVPPYWLVYFMVNDVDATAAKAKSLGGGIVVPPMAIADVGRFAVLRDPQGATSAVFTPNPRQ